MAVAIKIPHSPIKRENLMQSQGYCIMRVFHILCSQFYQRYEYLQDNQVLANDQNQEEHIYGVLELSIVEFREIY